MFVVLLLALEAHADEGMWMPQQIPDLASKFEELGFRGNPAVFANLTGHPMGAIVSLGNCTASFVSPDGLIVTNHHCAAGALQFNSTPEKNLIRDGFLAKTRGEELFNGPGARVYVTTSFTDVTNAITGGIDPAITDRQRYDLIDSRIKARIKQCEMDGSRCSVPAFFEGLRYYEIAQLEIKDVRLVYAPADGIGVFGGETDNWRWPRHTGDWAFLRAYVGKDGKPAPFAKDNLPYRPKHWLKVSPAGAEPGQFVLVVGYPGSTERHQTYSEVRVTTEWAFPRAIRLIQEQLAILERFASDNKETAIKLDGRIRGLNNTLTNLRGMLEGLVRGGILAKKETQERELVEWINADAERRKNYGGVLPALEALRVSAEKTRERDSVLGTLSSSSSYLGAAMRLYRLSTQRPLDDFARDPGYQERDWGRIREAMDRMQQTLDAGSDRALLRWAMGMAATLPADQRIQPIDEIVGLSPGMEKSAYERAIDAYLDSLYSHTVIGDRSSRLEFMVKSQAELDAANDAFIMLASRLHPLAEAVREAAKSRSGANARLRPRYMEALLAKAGGLIAPDANGTLRVTYGQIKGVEAKDGLFYLPQTTLAGISEKNTGEGDFNAPQKELEAIAALRRGEKTPYVDPALRDVPVNFLSTVDSTGGNSGSPTLNSAGELVGLLFDGTYETIASDYLYDSLKTRSIHVDSRYMLWTMEEVDGASNVLEEIGLR